MSFQPKHTGEIIEDGWYVLLRDDDEILAGPLADDRDAYEIAEHHESEQRETEVAFLLVAEIRAQQALDDDADAYFDRCI